MNFSKKICMFTLIRLVFVMNSNSVSRKTICLTDYMTITCLPIQNQTLPNSKEFTLENIILYQGTRAATQLVARRISKNTTITSTRMHRFQLSRHNIMRLQCHVFFLLLALTAAAAVDSRKEASGPKGVWTPIKDLNDTHVEHIAEFAISAHNSRPLEPVIPLKLQRIIKGETQVVAGTNYRLLLEACSLNGSPAHTGIYEAIVLERPEMFQSLSLTSFKPVHQT